MKVLNYKKSISTISALFILLISTVQIVKAECNQNDFKALKAFYESTNGDKWANNTGWEIIRNNETPPTNCRLGGLKGVFTNRNGRVVKLRFRGSSEAVAGSLPLGIYLLQELEEIEISNASLSGYIPQTIGYCKNLKVLNLKDNNITGNIPTSIRFLKNLTNLSLGNNQLRGEIPPQIANCTALNRVELYNNNFTGCIPSEIGNLTKMVTLNVSRNSLTGCIPVEIGKCENLKFCLLNDNSITDAIPHEIGNLTKLSRLNVTNNKLSGEIPAEIGQLNEINYFIAGNNNLTGSIPAELGNCKKLRHCILNNNSINGTIPEEIGDINNLKKFYIYNNQLVGCYPENLRSICETLDRTSNSDEKISNGNIFNESWENFDSRFMGMCGGSNKIASTSNELKEIYPNPSKGIINLAVEFEENTVNASSEISIYNATGSMVFNQSISNKLMNNYTINLNHLNKGNYIIMLNNNGAFHYQKFILN